MKKYIITAIVVITLIAAAIAGATYYLSFKKVTVTVERTGISADIYPVSAIADDGTPDKNAKITTVTNSTTLSLRADTYYIIPTTKNIDSAPITFTITDKDTAVTVNPGYSKDYLASLLPNELTAVKKMLIDTYPQLSSFTINDGTLYDDGSWYGTTLIQAAAGPGASGDVYRTVLHKVNGSWGIAAAPQLVLTSADNKDVPIAVLRDLNQQTGYTTAN